MDTSLEPAAGRDAAHHAVQFYDSDAALVSDVGAFIGAGLTAGSGAVIIATEPHRRALQSLLPRNGQDCLLLDAHHTLDTFMAGPVPDASRFAEVIGDAIDRASQRGRMPVRAFGEMVALLAEQGNTEGALRLEQLWNDMARQREFSLLCAYPLGLFAGSEHAAAFRRVCGAHTHVHATPLRSDRELAQLQQESATLRVELARLRETEAELRARERERVQLQQALEKKVEELAAANQHKDDFMAILGHELRNPLAPIANALEVMRRLPPDAGALHVQLREIIERQVLLMTRLVDDLLDAARIGRGKMALQLGAHHLGDTVQRALELARPHLHDRGHRLCVELPPGDVLLWSDDARIAQAIANLLINAAKYTGDDGRITLTATVEGGSLVISVADNGIGLSPDLRRRIFEPFVQGGPGEGHGGGLGIGLTLVRSIVHLHGGTIEAHSEGTGRGSCFVMRLPVHGAAAADVTAPAGHADADATVA